MIDILLATYNGEKYIREQIESIMNQSYSAFDLFIHDDGSTDGTKLIINEFEQRYDNIRIILKQEELKKIKTPLCPPVKEKEEEPGLAEEKVRGDGCGKSCSQSSVSQGIQRR